jgi:hypothetical protein
MVEFISHHTHHIKNPFLGVRGVKLLFVTCAALAFKLISGFFLKLKKVTSFTHLMLTIFFFLFFLL